jgi:hypothetical protein
MTTINMCNYNDCQNQFVFIKGFFHREDEKIHCILFPCQTTSKTHIARYKKEPREKG